ncbi:MAG TPA: phosphoenolpyruvate--protein phosphotransferase [Elusimicrobia bacterium]|nr:MAG: phosphoenolpyruvate--protein phosphotransferase [Elusimicrobia bacterium GWA2_66_18]OGR74056.1 MAG: phosphoenolpyruvate--protein phosphotransferase [Elusimicrobia bacterium GWC2_65_9]HAZ07743.1 phosphoenolpyruvate--protein phosphotransferase [Elusimicrobiota bacterium]
MIVIKGVAASPGIAIGKAYVVEDEDIVVERVEIGRSKIKDEVRRFKQAQKATLRDLDAAEQKVLKVLGKQHAKLIDAHRLILKDALITSDVPKRIVTEGVNAEFALSEALELVNRQFEKMDDEFFRERRHDLFDVGKRLLLHLMKRQKRSLAEIDHECVLIVRNLLPSDTLGLKETKILGFATDLGGKTSHTAILAQSLEIPAVVGLSDVSRRIKTGDMVILDGEQGMVIINPSSETVAKYQKVQERTAAEDRSLENLKGLPTVTADGRAFRLEVNLDSLEELKNVIALQADGIGLFRTESLFLNRTEAPGEDEQSKVYSAVVKAMDGREVIIRTADIGGDRLPHIGIEGLKSETNPFMGLRGVRLFLRHLDLFKTQLRAVLRSSLKGKVRVMIPMVSSVGEVLATKRLLDQAQAELAAEGVEFKEDIEFGIMVEIPSAAIQLDAFLPHVDFVSIGTNDLIQYVLAVDRVNEHVTHLYDPYHPAVVRLLDHVVQTAHKRGKWVGVCGEMTSDPRAVPLLVGMGVDAMSVSPRMFLRVKQAIRSLKHESMKRLVAKAVVCAESDEIRRLLEQHQ